MRSADRIDFPLALGALERCLTIGQAELVPIEGARLAAINDAYLLVAALAVHLSFLVVFDIAVALRNVSRWYLW